MITDSKPRAPSWLTSDQKLLWRKAIRNAPESLQQLDESLLAAWVVACDTHREASEKSAAVGLLVKSPTKGVPIQNPFLPIMNRQALIMMRAVRELGFSPAARRERQGAGDDLPQGKKNQAREAAMKVAAGKFSQAPPPKLVVNNS